jgi:hypothetical protein
MKARHSAPLPGASASAAERGAVGEAVPADRVQPPEGDELVERPTGDGGQLAEHVGQGQQRRTGLPGEPGGGALGKLPAGAVQSLEHHHVVAGRGEVDRRSEAAHSGADDHDRGHVSAPGSRPAW